MAILREEGINGHLEMAFAFFKAGFEAHDVHLSDLITGRTHLDQFQVLAACGGLAMEMFWALVVVGPAQFYIIKY